MFTGLFTRRPAPTPPTEDAGPTQWPAIGETWKPEGLPVAERYYNQANAVVLVASTGHDPNDTAHYLVACLGCHYLSTRTKHETYHIRYTLQKAADAANGHAGTCRALPRALPARPDETTARQLLRSWVLAMPRRHLYQEGHLDLSDFDSGRLKLQRTTEWIETELTALSIERSDLLSAKPNERTGAVQFRILPN